MQVNGQTLRTIWFDEDSGEIRIIDQTGLPHRFRTICLGSFAAACHAIERPLTTALCGGSNKKPAAPVLRHGHCPVKHRTFEAAQRCRNR